MKKSTKQTIVFILICLAACFADNLFAQSIVKDSAGNYLQVKHTRLESKPIETGKTFTDAKGNVYPVYLSANNKAFIIRTSKEGNTYKQYLKID